MNTIEATIAFVMAIDFGPFSITDVMRLIDTEIGHEIE